MYLPKPFALCLLGGAAIAALSGCGGSDGGGPANTPLSASVIEPNGLTATLSETSNTVSVGGNVVYTFAETNNTAAPITIPGFNSSPLRPIYTFEVKNASGIATYSFFPPGAIPTTTITLAPGQTISATQTATGYSATGAYACTAGFNESIPGTLVGPVFVTAK